MATASLNKRIMGLPLGFTKLADPNYRVFNKLFIRGATIITVVPGLPRFTEGNEVAAKYEELRGLVNETAESETAGVWQDAKTNILFNQDYYKEKADGKTAEYDRDRRYYSFFPSMSEYRKVVNVLFNEVGSKLASYGFFNLESYLDVGEAAYEGIHFYAENSTTVSESASNTLGDSILASTAKGIADQLREFAYISGRTEQEVGESNQGLLAGLTGLLQSAGSTAVGVASANGSRVMMGENVLYPKVWKDSSFERSYNISFKFVSPYGDPESIFEYVYAPFLLLLGLALPRQSTPNSYKAPFLLRLDCPGYFNCDMGMISSFSFVKGGSEGLWNENGLPMCMDVTMSVADLYPTLMVSTDIALLRNNIGLSTFLDNMCGLAIMKANIRANLRGSIASKLGMFAGVGTTVTTAADDMINRAAMSIFHIN
jgi:hypothetical protein